MSPRRIIIVGLGGIGSILADGMARALQFKDPDSILILVDGDNYEPKNAERQFFESLGNKAEVKAAELQPYFDKIFIAPRSQWVIEKFEEEGIEEVEGAITAKALLEEGDIVFAVVDNFAARKILFDAARELDNIDIFTGGNDDALMVSVWHYQRRNGEDVTDHPGEVHEAFINPPDRNPGLMSCQEKAELEGGTQFLASNMAAAALLMGRYQHCIIEGNEPCSAGEIMLDLGLGLASPRNIAADPVMASVE